MNTLIGRKEGIRETARLFKASGIRVMLKPQIWMGHGNFTGHINMDTEANWKLLEQQINKVLKKRKNSDDCLKGIKEGTLTGNSAIPCFSDSFRADSFSLTD